MAGKSYGGQTVTDKKIEVRILSVFMDGRPGRLFIKKGKFAEVLWKADDRVLG